MQPYNFSPLPQLCAILVSHSGLHAVPLLFVSHVGSLLMSHLQPEVVPRSRISHHACRASGDVGLIEAYLMNILAMWHRGHTVS